MMSHDKANVTRLVGMLIRKLDSGDAYGNAVHTSGGAPRQSDKWRDPCDEWGNVDYCELDAEKIVVEQLPSIEADSDEQAAAWCLAGYICGRLPDVCSEDTPERAITDICLHFYNADHSLIG
jgi:hypothetical protein